LEVMRSPIPLTHCGEPRRTAVASDILQSPELGRSLAAAVLTAIRNRTPERATRRFSGQTAFLACVRKEYSVILRLTWSWSWLKQNARFVTVSAGGSMCARGSP